MKQYNETLQLFAAPLQTTGTEGLSAEMKTFYDGCLLDNAEPNLVHEQFGDEYPIPQGRGKVIEFRKFSRLNKAMTPLTEGVTPEGNTLNVTASTATVQQYGDYIQMSDMLDMTALDNTVVQATRLLGAQAGLTLDSVAREVLNGGTNVLYAPKVVDGVETPVESRKSLDKTCLLTPDLIYRAAAFLKTSLCDRIDGDYVAIVHPYVAYDLMRQEEWIDAHKYADPDKLYNGEIGKLGGVRFVESSEAKIWNDDSTPEGLAVFSTLVLGAHAYAKTAVTGGGLETIVKPLGYGEDPLNQRSSVGWKATSAIKRLSEEFMVRIESCSSRYSETAQAN